MRIFFTKSSWLILLIALFLGCGEDRSDLIEMQERLSGAITHINLNAGSTFSLQNHRMALASVEEAIDCGKSRPEVSVPYVCAVRKSPVGLQVTLYWVQGNDDIELVRFDVDGEPVETLDIDNLDQRGWIKLQGLVVFFMTTDATTLTNEEKVFKVDVATINRISEALTSGRVGVSLRTKSGLWTASCIAISE